jgi:hypothetical protein
MLILESRSPTLGLTASWRQANPALWAIVGGALAALAIVLAIPALREVFGLARPHFDDVVVCALAALAAFAWMELVKLATRRASLLRRESVTDIVH